RQSARPGRSHRPRWLSVRGPRSEPAQSSAAAYPQAAVASGCDRSVIQSPSKSIARKFYETDVEGARVPDGIHFARRYADLDGVRTRKASANSRSDMGGEDPHARRRVAERHRVPASRAEGCPTGHLHVYTVYRRFLYG